MRSLRPCLAFVLVCSFIVLSACRQSTSAASSTPAQAPAATTAAPAPPAEVPYDHQLTDVARLLAGLAPDATGSLATIASKPEWKAWQKEFDTQWTQATKERFERIATWRKQELDPPTGNCETLMYPFAGPDILNAVLLFPDCRRYVLFGLEMTGTLPTLDQLPPERLSRLLDETRKALNDLLERNYFITSHMMTETSAKELRGVLPLMTVILARLDARIIKVREAEIAEDGTLQDRTPTAPTKKVASAVEFEFVRPGHQPQTVVYFRGDVQDKALAQRPGVVKYLEQQGSYPTFLKSASYLLHGNEFSKIRGALLAHSRLVLTDDSGLPYRYVNSEDWTVTLFGTYQKPIKDFNYGYQADLAKAFVTSKNVKPLNFSFGYHWKQEGAPVLLAVRTKPSA